MIYSISIFSLMIISLMFIDRNIVGQEETVGNNFSPVLSNDTIANQIARSLERLIEQNDILIEQNDDSSRTAVTSSYLGMMAFLVGLALVIFGLQLSRAERITSTARKYYRILILVLILPVVGLLIFGFFSSGQEASDYLGVGLLLMIPSGAVLVLMASRKLYEKL